MFSLFCCCTKKEQLTLARQLIAKLGYKRNLSFQMWDQCVSEAKNNLGRDLYVDPSSLYPLNKAQIQNLHLTLCMYNSLVGERTVNVQVALRSIGIFSKKMFRLNLPVKLLCERYP